MGSKKFLKTVFVFANGFENQLHKLGPIGHANLFAYDFGKRGLVLVITTEIEPEISRLLCKGFFIGKEFEKRPRSSLRLLRELAGFNIKSHCLSTGLSCKYMLKIKQKKQDKSKFTHVNSREK